MNKEEESKEYVLKYFGAHAFAVDNARILGINVAIMINELHRDHEYSMEHLINLFPYMSDKEIKESYKKYKTLSK